MKRAVYTIIILTMLVSCRKHISITIRDQAFYKPDVTLSVVPLDNNNKTLLLADQLRNYLAVNGKWRILNKEATENMIFGQIYPLDLKTSYTGVDYSKEADLSGVTTEYLLLVSLSSVTTIEKSSSDGGSSTSLKIKFQVILKDRKTGDNLYDGMLSSGSTASAVGGIVNYINGSGFGTIDGVDLLAKAISRELIKNKPAL